MLWPTTKRRHNITWHLSARKVRRQRVHMWSYPARMLTATDSLYGHFLRCYSATHVNTHLSCSSYYVLPPPPFGVLVGAAGLSHFAHMRQRGRATDGGGQFSFSTRPCARFATGTVGCCYYSCRWIDSAHSTCPVTCERVRNKKKRDKDKTMRPLLLPLQLFLWISLAPIKCMQFQSCNELSHSSDSPPALFVRLAPTLRKRAFPTERFSVLVITRTEIADRIVWWRSLGRWTDQWGEKSFLLHFTWRPYQRERERKLSLVWQ